MKMFNKTKTGHTYFQWAFGLLANITLLAYGMECGWISPTTKILQSDASPTGYPLSDNAISWVASAMSMAAIFGVYLYSYIADRYGRRMGVIIIAIPEAISWIIKLSYSSLTSLIIARMFAGVAAAGCFNVVPMYIKEISQDDMRGILGTLPNLMQTTGFLVMYLLGAYLEYYTVIWITLCLPIVTALLFIKAPEAPAFLIKQGKIDEAIETVAFLRGLDKDDKIVHSIIDQMKNEEEYFKTLSNINIMSIFKDKTWRSGFILIVSCFFFHALNGVTAILTYASAILISTGVKFDISPEIQVISFPIVTILSSLLLLICVERFGRKHLLTLVHLVSGFAMAAVAVMMIIQERGVSVPAWMPVLALVLAVAMYGAGVASLPYIIMTEMFSFQIRAKAVGTVITFAWSMTFFVVIVYQPMCTALGSYAPFIFYAAINFGGGIFASVFLPETRGKSEEEIKQILSGKNIKEEDTT